MNHVILIGRLGNDAETKHTMGGAMIVSFSLATTSKWVDKQSGKTQERTEWHRCSAWGERWKNVTPYLQKGTQISVTGEIRYRQVEKDGVKQTYTDIAVDNIELLGSKREVQPAAKSMQQTMDEIDDMPL